MAVTHSMASPTSDAHTVLSLEQVDDVDRRLTKILLQSAMIDFTFLQCNHLELRDRFANVTVREAIQELLTDINEAARGIEAVMTASGPTRAARA